MDCKQCKAEMKKMYQSTGWIQKHFHWCPECGTMLIKEYIINNEPEQTWYKPGYIFEQEGL